MRDAHAESADAASLIARVADGRRYVNASRLGRGPDAGGVLVDVGMLIAGADERRARDIVLRLAPLFRLGIIDEIDVLVSFEVLILPAVLPLFVAELLRGHVRFAVFVLDFRIEGRGIEADVAVHVDQKRELIAGSHVRREIDRLRRKSCVRDVLPAIGRPHLFFVEQIPSH